MTEPAEIRLLCAGCRVLTEIVDECLIVKCAIVQYDYIDRVCGVVDGDYLNIHICCVGRRGWGCVEGLGIVCSCLITIVGSCVVCCWGDIGSNDRWHDNRYIARSAIIGIASIASTT